MSHSFEAIQFTKILGFNFIDSARKSYENTIFGDNLNDSNYKTYCYLQFYNKVVIYDQKVFNLYFSMILNNTDIYKDFSKFSLTKIEINKFDYTKSDDGSTKIYYTK